MTRAVFIITDGAVHPATLRSAAGSWWRVRDDVTGETRRIGHHDVFSTRDAAEREHDTREQALTDEIMSMAS